MGNEEKTVETEEIQSNTETDISLQHDDQAEELGGHHVSLNDLHKGAKKVISGGKIVDPNVAKEFNNQTAQGSETAEQTTESQEETAAESTDESTDDQEQSLGTPERVKIGDLELTSDEWKEAHKAYENMSAWQKNLTLRSQLASRMDDETLNMMQPYVYKQKEIPENLAEIALKDTDLPKTIEVTTEDGDVVAINTKDLPKELLESLGKNAFNKIWPELDQLRNEVEEKSKTATEQMQQVERWQAIEMTKDAVNFMKEHPDYAIQLGKGQLFINAMASILSSGDIHPELPKALKLQALLQHRQKNGGSFEDAYMAFEGDNVAKKKIADKIKKNQEDDIPPEKGGEHQVKTRGQQRVDSFRDSKHRELMDTFAG